MKKNGFTLIELLAVIAILAIIIVFAIPNVSKVIQRQQQNLSKQAMDNLGDAAISYALEHVFLTECEDGFEPTSVNSTSKSKCTTKLSVETIVNSGFFDDDKASCDKDKFVLVYRYISKNNGEDIDEYRFYMESDTCYAK